MKKDDRKKFGTIMVGIGEIYSKEISKELMQIYWSLLEGYEIEDVESAFSTHVKNPDVGQFFPKPADIIRVIEGSGENKALLAWTKFEDAVRRFGAHQSIIFDDVLIHAVIRDMGGWIELNSMTLRELPFKANEFQKRYMGFLNKPPNNPPAYCVGIFEGENRINGFEVKPPVLIGDLKEARSVDKKDMRGELGVNVDKLLENLRLVE